MEFVYDIIYKITIDEIRDYFQDLKNVKLMSARQRVNELYRNAIEEFDGGANPGMDEFVEFVVKRVQLSDENFEIPRKLRLRIEMMLRLVLRPKSQNKDIFTIPSKEEEEEEGMTSIPNFSDAGVSQRREWIVRVMTDEFRLATARHPPISSFERLLPCGTSNNSVIFTVLPNGNDDVDYSYNSDSTHDNNNNNNNVVNPSICGDPLISSMTYSCPEDEEGYEITLSFQCSLSLSFSLLHLQYIHTPLNHSITLVPSNTLFLRYSHTVRFTTSVSSKEVADAEIYFTYFDSTSRHFRFPGITMSEIEKRPLRIHFQWESTANDNTARNIEWLRNIDAIWSYRSSSDIFSPYRYLGPFLNHLLFRESGEEHHTIERSRSKLAIWVQRMCEAHNGRERYVKELMRYMQIDSFGKCLHNVGNRTIPRKPRSALIRVASQYKFYFAIENSNCVDYITEKLNTAIESGAVPVVFAPNNVPDYRKILPSGSYVNLADFSSVKEAAAYLLRVASDDKLYKSFRWFDDLDENKRVALKQAFMKKWPTEGTEEDRVCQLVKKLKSWHGDDDEQPHRAKQSDAILFHKLANKTWYEMNDQARDVEVRRIYDKTCLVKNSMLAFI